MNNKESIETNNTEQPNSDTKWIKYIEDAVANKDIIIKFDDQNFENFQVLVLVDLEKCT